MATVLLSLLNNILCGICETPSRTL